MIKKTDDFVKELAKEFDLPEFIVGQVLRSPFKFLRSIMDKKEFETVMFPYLGKFGVAANTKKYMLKHLHERDIKGSTEQAAEQRGGESQGQGRDLQEV
jgi:hypothetical protein